MAGRRVGSKGTNSWARGRVCHVGHAGDLTILTGGGGPCGVVELPKNRLQDVVQPTQDVICGEPEHSEPATHQPGGPSTVVFNSIVVTRAVDLDQQPPGSRRPPPPAYGRVLPRLSR